MHEITGYGKDEDTIPPILTMNGGDIAGSFITHSTLHVHYLRTLDIESLNSFMGALDHIRSSVDNVISQIKGESANDIL